jgi:transposase
VERTATQGRTARLRELAARILPVLQERKQQETDRRILLRGSSEPDIDPAYLQRSTLHQDAPESMLRPAAYTPDTAPQQLLRSMPLPSEEE